MNYEVIEDYAGDLRGGQEARRYEDGSIRNDKGWMLEPLPGGGIQTSEQAREIGRVRWEKLREDAREGARRKVAEIKNLDIKELKQGDEVAYVAEHITELLLTSKNSRGVAELGRLWLEMLGYKNIREEIPATDVNIITNKTTSKILDVLKERLNADVVDASAE